MNGWKDTRVLVTGAGGFIGSHLAERLVQDGAQVRAFVHYNALGSAGWLQGSEARDAVDLFAGDVADRDSVRKAVADVQVVFHLAALIGIPYSYEAPVSYLRTNVEGTMNVLHAAKECGVERVVHTSTSEVYGTARQVPMSEDHPLQGQSPYAASKIGADKMVEAFHRCFEVPAVTVRPFNTFGPRQSARAVVPTIITQCLAGKTVRLGNLDPTRDLNYVSNTVDGFLAAGRASGVEGQTINLGSGREIRIGDLCDLIGELVGQSVEVVSEPDRVRPENSEVDRLFADNRLAAELLDWTPSVSLEDGLRMTIEWIRENISGYRPGVYTV